MTKRLRGELGIEHKKPVVNSRLSPGKKKQNKPVSKKITIQTAMYPQ
jgi:hypothetical protein